VESHGRLPRARKNGNVTPEEKKGGREEGGKGGRIEKKLRHVVKS